MKYAIIAGTGFEDTQSLKNGKTVKTPYGDVTVYTCVNKETEYYYIPRHGEEHSVPPHKINYRANVYALKELGTDLTFSLCAVGSIREELSPGTLVLIKDILDRTKMRISTFYDGDRLPLKHLDVSDIYSKKIREFLKSSFRKTGNLEIPEGVYVCTEGPRFETATEIREYRLLGCDVVGMTNAPEIFLLAEAGIYRATIAYVTNYCTGVSEKGVELTGSYSQADAKIKAAIEDTVLSVKDLKNLGKPAEFF